MSGKLPTFNRTPGLYFVPEKGKASPMMKALAQAAREARQKGETPIFFSRPKGTDQNPEGETK